MARDALHRCVRDACLWLPEAEEFISHGSPNFRVRGRSFATFAVNHHGDGRVALWLAAAPGAQEHCVQADPNRFFVPPYVGPRGWLGVQLDKGVAWTRIVTLVREAYERVTPPSLHLLIGTPPVIQGAKARLPAGDIDPMQTPRGRFVLKIMRSICLPLPEAREKVQFGFPVWQAATKTFAGTRWAEQRMSLNFWVGVERQGWLTNDERYRVPAYLGHNGWISLDVTETCDRLEVAALSLDSYRHFALKRMLRELK